MQMTASDIHDLHQAGYVVSERLVVHVSCSLLPMPALMCAVWLVLC